MRKKRVWRYYCDHCKKAGCSAGAMVKHERHCCGNPDRVCRMCAVDQAEANEQKPMAELVAAFGAGGVEAVRVVAGGCPACILAAMINWRKQNPGVPDPGGLFDFRREAKDWLSEHTAERDYAY